MHNYNEFSKKQNDENQEPLKQIDEIISQPVEVEESGEETFEPNTFEGVVSGCEQLYVRSDASVDSEPLGIIKRDTVLVIYESESTEDFYNVCTESGLEGFCMKKFISVL